MYHKVELACPVCKCKKWIEHKECASNYINCCEEKMQLTGCEKYSVKRAIEIGIKNNCS